MQTGLPPSHLVPLSSSVAVKKKKRRRDRAALLADSRSSSSTHGYVAPLQPPVISHQPRSSSAAVPRGRTEPAVHTDSVDVEPTRATQEVFVQSTAERPASRGNRSDAWTPKSVNFVCHIGKDCLLFVVFLWCIVMQSTFYDKYSSHSIYLSHHYSQPCLSLLKCRLVHQPNFTAV